MEMQILFALILSACIVGYVARRYKRYKEAQLPDISYERLSTLLRGDVQIEGEGNSASTYVNRRLADDECKVIYRSGEIPYELEELLICMPGHKDLLMRFVGPHLLISECISLHNGRVYYREDPNRLFETPSVYALLERIHRHLDSVPA